jgi:hypothetical protein
VSSFLSKDCCALLSLCFVGDERFFSNDAITISRRSVQQTCRNTAKIRYFMYTVLYTLVFEWFFQYIITVSFIVGSTCRGCIHSLKFVIIC